MRTKVNGFTLIEAMIAMTIAAILLAVAVPAWSNARATVYAGTTRAEMAATILDAVRHSTVTATEVVVCSSADGNHCSGQPDWTHGWIAFADLDGNRVREARETLLKHAPHLASGMRLRSTQGRTRLVFHPNGGNAGSNVTFTFCAEHKPYQATTLILANDGRIRAGRPTEAAAAACAYGS